MGCALLSNRIRRQRLETVGRIRSPLTGLAFLNLGNLDRVRGIGPLHQGHDAECLVALGVDEYWEGREEQELARGALERVAIEMQENRTELAESRANNLELMESLRMALDAIAAGEGVGLQSVNFEVSLLAVDQPFASEVAAMLAEDFTNSRKMRSGEFAEKPWWFRLAARVARLTAPIL